MVAGVLKIFIESKKQGLVTAIELDPAQRSISIYSSVPDAILQKGRDFFWNMLHLWERRSVFGSCVQNITKHGIDRMYFVNEKGQIQEQCSDSDEGMDPSRHDVLHGDRESREYEHMHVVYEDGDLTVDKVRRMLEQLTNCEEESAGRSIDILNAGPKFVDEVVDAYSKHLEQAKSANVAKESSVNLRVVSRYKDCQSGHHDSKSVDGHNQALGLASNQGRVTKWQGMTLGLKPNRINGGALQPPNALPPTRGTGVNPTQFLMAFMIISAVMGGMLWFFTRETSQKQQKRGNSKADQSQRLQGNKVVRSVTSGHRA